MLQFGGLESRTICTRSVALIGFLFSLGFKKVGEAVTYDDWPRRGTQAQSLICDLGESAGQWETVEREFREKTPVKIENR